MRKTGMALAIRLAGRMLPALAVVLLISIPLSASFLRAESLPAESSYAESLPSETLSAESSSAGSLPAESSSAESQSTESFSTAGGTKEPPEEGTFRIQGEAVSLDESWQWASNSAIHTGSAMLYRAPENEEKPRRNFTVCVNAGHGTFGGSEQQTLSHPDGTAKVTGGTNAEGTVWSTAISTGTVFLDGTDEASVSLEVALDLKDRLLGDGYDVLMIRESDDVQLDNIARTVIANNCADIHVAIHFDSTDYDKGVYFCSVPDDPSYRQMEPVKSHWQEHMALGQALIQGLSGQGLALFGDGTLQMDLTQTSYSTIPSVDIELGDTASDHSAEACGRYAQGLKEGIDLFFRSRAGE